MTATLRRAASWLRGTSRTFERAADIASTWTLTTPAARDWARWWATPYTGLRPGGSE